MSNSREKLHVLNDPRAEQILLELHADANRQNAKLVGRFVRYLPRLLFGRPLPWHNLERKFDDLYLAMDPDNGIFCYLMARALGARQIVEFGSSFGISTIYLALAVRDNGGGSVIATEMVGAKAERARQNYQRAGVADLIDLRLGNAEETLQGLTTPVDMFINDGFPRYAMSVTHLVAPLMRPGAVALCGNAVLFQRDYAQYVAWMRDPRNGFRSTRSSMALLGEFSVKTTAARLP
jgi:predicted O-methyltransferase YrrM